MVGPVGKTNLYSLVVLSFRQVDDVPPWAENPKNMDAKYFKRLKLKPKN